MTKIWDKLVLLGYMIRDYSHDFYCAAFKYPGRTFLKRLAPYSEHAEWLLTLYSHIDGDKWWIKFNHEGGYINDKVLITCIETHDLTVDRYNEGKYWFLDAKEYFNKD